MRGTSGITTGLSQAERHSRGILTKVAARLADQQRQDRTAISESPPGVRFIHGRPYYSADWLNRPPTATHRRNAD
jgi:hypothetical protein